MVQFKSDRIISESDREAKLRATARGEVGVAVVALALLGYFVWSVTPDSIRYKAFYCVYCQVGVRHVEVDKRPIDCEWTHSPLGGKGCHYEKRLNFVRDKRDRVVDVYVMWSRVSD